MKKSSCVIHITVVMLAITLPFGLATLAAGRDFVYTGLLLNPTDGASYLAKMYEGWSGAWRFTLPYSAEPGDGAAVYLYYLFLGHLARWSGIPLVITYHLARLCGAGLLLYALMRFLSLAFPERPDLVRVAYWFGALGSGMGWLVLFLNQLTSDFWVAEAYPFLAMLTNPHFPTGLALILLSLTLLVDPIVRFRNIYLLFLGLLTSIVFNFGFVILLLVAIGTMIWNWIERRRLDWQPVFFLGLLGGPCLLYQYWAVQTDPILSMWNIQNQTASPAVWDFLLSFSPALLLAPLGIVHLLKMKGNPVRPILIIWLALELLLIYFPFSLQRRFLLGFFIPTSALAVFGVDFVRQRYAQKARWLVPAVFMLALPTNLLVLLIGLFGAISHAPVLYLSQDEARAMDWIRAETPSRALVLASPELGNLIPAFTGRRVIYGHPYETINATVKEKQVREFYRQLQNNPIEGNFLKDQKVNFVLYGPRERQLGGRLDLSAFPKVFNSETVQIFSTSPEQ